MNKATNPFLLLLAATMLGGCPDVGTTPTDTTGSDDDDNTDSDDPSTTITATSPSTTATTMTATDPTTDPTSDTTGDPPDDTTGDPPDETTTGGPPDTTTGDPTTGGMTEGMTDGMTTGVVLACADADLGTTTPQTANDDNTGAGDDVLLSCSGNGGGEEFQYQFTTTLAGLYSFDTIGSAADTALGILDDCDGNELACNDDLALGTLQSAVLVDLAADQTVVVVVDSWGGDVGPFTLNVDYLGSEDLEGFCDAIGGTLATCDDVSTNSLTQAGTLMCDETFFYWDVYELDVAAGDCVSVNADNIDPIAGATGAESGDLLIVIEDENSDDIIFDDEQPCTDPAFGGFACPAGAFTALVGGTVQIGLSQYGGPACPDGSPYSLNVAINGVDQDVSGGPANDDASALCQ